MSKSVATSEKALSRTEQREQDIIDAAMRLFADEGYENTSTRSIAAEAGVSEGTLFNYFPSKRELLGRAMGRIYESLSTVASEGIRERLNTRERLQFMAENHARQMLDNNALFNRLIGAYMASDQTFYINFKDSVIHKGNKSYTWIFDLVIREGIERGEIRQDINLPTVRDLFFGGLEYQARTIMLHGRLPELSDWVDGLVEILWRSIGTTGETNEGTESRLDATYERLEAVTRKLEKLAK